MVVRRKAVLVALTPRTVYTKWAMTPNNIQPSHRPGDIPEGHRLHEGQVINLNNFVILSYFGDSTVFSC